MLVTFPSFFSGVQGLGPDRPIVPQGTRAGCLPGQISDPAKALLGSLINRLPPSDRPRLRAYCYKLIAATTTLGVARHPRRLSPDPLRLFQSSPAHSWRCDSFQRTFPPPSTRPVPPTATKSPHHATVSQPSSPLFRPHRVPLEFRIPTFFPANC